MGRASDLERTYPLDDDVDVWGNPWRTRRPAEPELQVAPAPERRGFGSRSRRRNPWKDVPWGKRRAIMRALRSDELLRDPKDAEFLLRVAPVLRRLYARQRTPWRLFVRIAVVVWLVGEIAYGVGRTGTISPSFIVPLFWLALDVRILFRSHTRLPQLQRAEDRHREYLRSIGHPVPAATADAPPLPVRKELILSFFLCVASFLCLFLVEYLPLLRDRGSSARLVVYGLVLVTAIGLGLAAATIAARSWRLARGFERRSEPAALVVVGLALATGWAIGLVNVFFHGA